MLDWTWNSTRQPARSRSSAVVTTISGLSSAAIRVLKSCNAISAPFLGHEGYVTTDPARSSCGDAVPDFEHGAAGRRAVGAVGHARPTARVVPGPERPPERKVGEFAFQQVHLLDVVVGDHADTTGVQTWHPPYEPRKHSRVIGIPGQHLLLRARLLGLLPRHGVRGEELKLPFHPTDS